jgi:DNA-binding response OmpR family regulator
MTRLAGARILLIEPDILLAIHLADEFVRQGAAIPTVTPSLERARIASDYPNLAAAIIEPSLEDGDPTTVVSQLLERRVPVLVTSQLPLERQHPLLRSCSFVRKPYAPRTLSLRVADMIDGATVLELDPKPHLRAEGA